MTVAAVATVLTLAALEGVARVSLPDVMPSFPMYRPDPDVVYALRPGFRGIGQLGETIRINGAGLRGDELRPRTADGKRVVVVGDSFTFGLGVAEDATIPSALGALLGPTVEVLDAGVPGYNLYQERRFIAHRVPALRADVVVLVLIENDLYNLDGSDLVARSDGTLARRAGSVHPEMPVNPFAALSGPWLWLQLHSAAFREATFVGIAIELATNGDRELAARALAIEHASDLPARLLRGEDDAETMPRWRAAEQELVAAVAASPVPLVVVLFPRPEQLYSDRLRGGFERLARIARSAGAAGVIDVALAFIASKDRPTLYLFPRDHHPSAYGYAVAARCVAPTIAALCLG